MLKSDAGFSENGQSCTAFGKTGPFANTRENPVTILMANRYRIDSTNGVLIRAFVGQSTLFGPVHIVISYFQ